MIDKVFSLAKPLWWAVRRPPRAPVPREFLNLGKRALQLAERIAGLGPRPPGSRAHARLQEIILSEFGGLDCEVDEERFVAQTPIGLIPMRNYVAKFS